MWEILFVVLHHWRNIPCEVFDHSKKQYKEENYNHFLGKDVLTIFFR